MALAPAGGQKPAPRSSQTNIVGPKSGGKLGPGTSVPNTGRRIAPVKGNNKTPR